MKMFCLSSGQVVTGFLCRPGRLTSLLRWQTSLEFLSVFTVYQQQFLVSIKFEK